MRKMIAAGLCVLLILFTACVQRQPMGEVQPPAVERGNPVTAEPPPDVCALYAPVLESWEKAIRENGGGTEYPFIRQFIPFEFWQAHYAYYDMDGNGIPELLIASFYDFEYYHLADVYTIHDGAPVRLFEGIEDRGFWPRNRLDFSHDGTALITAGSGGAAYTSINFYRVADSGYQVTLLEGLTTFNPDNTGDYTPYHRLSNGTYEIATDFDGVMEKYYGEKYLTRNETYDYASDFPTQMDWTPIAQAVPLTGIVTIPIQGEEYQPRPMPDLLEVTLAEKPILSEHTLADGTELCWYLDGVSAACAYRKPGGVWVRFIVEDSAYRDGFGFGTYTDLFGHSGFTVTAPRGLAYFAYDYYYLDATGTPRLLFGGTYLDQIGDFNGDGENELLYFYHAGEMANYYYQLDGKIYVFDITTALRARFPGWENVNANPYPLPDNTLQVTYSVSDAEYTLQIRFTAEKMFLSALSP